MRNNQPWKPYEDQVMRALYPDTANAQLASLLDRSEPAIRNRSVTLGIKKTAAFSERQKHLTQFKKGFTPWNKGKKFPGTGRSLETQFQKGHKPSNWKPIGSERISKEGYLQRKMTDTGVTRKDFVPAHHLVWVEHTGQQVPKGYALTFKDGNKTNLNISNLELLSRADLMRRNSIITLPPEVRKQVHLVCGFKRRLRRIQRERNSREPAQHTKSDH